MKKFFILLFSLIVLFSSCSSTEDIMPVAENAEEVTVPSKKEPEWASEKIEVKASVPDVRKPAEEKKEEEKPVFPEEEKPLEKEEAPQLTGRELANQIDSKLRGETETAPETENEAPVEEKTENVPVVEEKAEKPVESADQPQSAKEEEPEVPSVIKEEVKEEKPVVAETEKETAEQSPFDAEMNDGVFSLFISLVIVISIYTLSSVIRSRYGMPLPWHVSLVFSLLLTLVPMLTSYLLEGWKIYQLIYASVILTYYVFRAKNRKH